MRDGNLRREERDDGGLNDRRRDARGRVSYPIRVPYPIRSFLRDGRRRVESVTTRAPRGALRTVRIRAGSTPRLIAACVSRRTARGWCTRRRAGFPRELGPSGDGDGDVRFQGEGREVHLGHDEVGRFLREDDVVPWFEVGEKADSSDANAGGFCRLGLPRGSGNQGRVARDAPALVNRPVLMAPLPL